VRNIVTRFRAYRLGSAGSSFSYYADGHFTLLEGRLTKESRPSILDEMNICSVVCADTLHITSWDDDHCQAAELPELLALIRPNKIECPGYIPHTENGELCKAIVNRYIDERQYSNQMTHVKYITPTYISSLPEAEALAFRDIYHGPLSIDPSCDNNNSTIKHFRKGSFNVLSLGDVESTNISARLRRGRTLGRETDVMILAHHGADNGFTNKQLLAHLEPKIAICSSNYGNEYDHPRQEIRDLLFERGIKLYTTKTGDVIINSVGDHTGQYRITNFIAKSTEFSSQCSFTSKKKRLLSFNADTIRESYRAKRRYPR
jgi:competence protein ComEC